MSTPVISPTQQIIPLIPELIANVVGGREELEKIAGHLVWKDEFCGLDYIDCIKPKHMPDHNVVVGMSSNNRPFLAIKMTEFMPDQDPRTFVICIFQRYRNSPASWVGGTPYTGRLSPSHYFLDGSVTEWCCELSAKLFTLYKRVIRNGYKCYTGFDT